MSFTVRWRLACTGLSLVLLASSAAAQLNPVDVTVSTQINSMYVWNAFDRLAARGLESGPVLQPQVSFNVLGSPVTTHVAGSFVLNGEAELHESVFGVTASKSVAPVASFGLGYNYYNDRASNAGAAGSAPTEMAAAVAGDTHELWATLQLVSPNGARPVLAVKYENPTASGIDDYIVAQAGLSFGVPLVPARGLAGTGVELEWFTHVIYTTGITAGGNELVPRGMSAWQAGVAGLVSAGNVQIAPRLNYQITIEESVLDKNPFWAGLGVSYVF